MSVKRTLTNRLAAALVALGLAVVGIAHSPAPTAPPDPMVAAWLQAGGSLDDICLVDSGSADLSQKQDCPVCALTKAVALAVSVTAPRPGARLVVVHQPQAVAHLADGHALPAPPARGPPASFV